MFQVSDVVRNKAVMAGAPWWIEQLPDLGAVLADEWEFTRAARSTAGRNHSSSR